MLQGGTHENICPSNRRELNLPIAKEVSPVSPTEIFGTTSPKIVHKSLKCRIKLGCCFLPTGYGNPKDATCSGILLSWPQKFASLHLTTILIDCRVAPHSHIHKSPISMNVSMSFYKNWWKHLSIGGFLCWDSWISTGFFSEKNRSQGTVDVPWPGPNGLLKHKP